MQRLKEEYKSSRKPKWCDNCGIYNVLDAMAASFAELGLDPDNTVVVSGVGCSSRLPFYTSTYGFHTIHGRALPVSTGIKTANPERTVVTVGGDGDGFSIGGNHFIHTSRRNPNITYIVMDNEIYGFTKGQNSPTSRKDLITKINPYQSVEDRINPVLMALSFNTTFIARTFSDDAEQMKNLITQGILHRGFSFIHILSECTQYNTDTRWENLKKRIRRLPENHDVTNRLDGMKLAFTDEHIYTGLFYKISEPTLQERLQEVYDIALDGKKVGEYSIQDVLKQFE